MPCPLPTSARSVLFCTCLCSALVPGGGVGQPGIWGGGVFLGILDPTIGPRSVESQEGSRVGNKDRVHGRGSCLRASLGHAGSGIVPHGHSRALTWVPGSNHAQTPKALGECSDGRGPCVSAVAFLWTRTGLLQPVPPLCVHPSGARAAAPALPPVCALWFCDGPLLSSSSSS